MTWEEIKDKYDSEDDDAPCIYDLTDEERVAIVAGLDGEELVAALEGARGCGCCTYGIAGAVKGEIFDEVMERLDPS